MALQGEVFYDRAIIVILCDFITFIIVFSIILWIFARVLDAHARKQLFFSWRVVFDAKGLLKHRKSYEIFFFGTSGTLHHPYPWQTLFVISLKKFTHEFKWGLKILTRTFFDKMYISRFGFKNAIKNEESHFLTRICEIRKKCWNAKLFA